MLMFLNEIALKQHFGIAFEHIPCRAVKNLENANLNLSWKFEVFWGLAPKNLIILNLYYPQNLIFNLKNAVLILTSNFEVLFEDPQKPQISRRHPQAKQTRREWWGSIQFICQ